MSKTFTEWKEGLLKAGYEVLKEGACSKCGAFAVQMLHSRTSVIHARCTECTWSDTGFGGPKVMTWAQACARSYG